MDDLSSRSTWGLSNSATSPLSITKTLSEWNTVFSLWAIVITVACSNFSCINFWMTSSVLISMFAVASSIKTILFFLIIALQMQISCFSPELKFWPFSSIIYEIELKRILKCKFECYYQIYDHIDWHMNLTDYLINYLFESFVISQS